MMKISKILLLSAASILTLTACGGNADPSGTSSTTQQSGSSTTAPEPVLTEVDFDTFKSKSLNLPASPFDLVSTAYHANGYQGTYPIDINKTVTLTKKSSEWTIDVAPTHVDYACATQCKGILDEITLAKLVAAGKPTDGTIVNYYYNEVLGFKLEASGSFDDGDGSLVMSTTIGVWNIYGDLTKYDTHTIDNDAQPESRSDVHVITDFTYSTSQPPSPGPIGDDDVEIKAIKDGVSAIMNEENMTVKMTISEEMGGMPGTPNEEIAVLEGHELYSKNASSYGNHYEAVTKKEDKYLHSEFTDEHSYDQFKYVDQNHAKDLMLHQYFDNGLISAIDYLASVKSFEKFGDFLIVNIMDDMGEFTKDDYKTVVKKESTTDGKTVSINVVMNDEWVSKQIIQGMQMSHFEVTCSFTYNDKYLLSYINSQTMSFLVQGIEMSMVGDALCSFSNEVDQTFKSEILEKLGSIVLPEKINSASTSMIFNVDGYRIYDTYISNYEDKNAFSNALNAALNGENSDLNKILHQILPPLGNTITVKYFFNGKEVTNLSNITLSSYSNIINIEVNAADENKCAVMYQYDERTQKEHGYSSSLAYKCVVVDKTDSYTIETTFAGKSYADMYGTINVRLTEPIYDISKLSSIFFICVKVIPYVPGPLVGKTFKLDSITNYDDIKNLVLQDGTTTVGEKLDELANCEVTFEGESNCSLILENGIEFSGGYIKHEDDSYSVSFYDYSSGHEDFYWTFTYSSDNNTINAEYELLLEGFTAVTAYLVLTIK